MATCGKTDVGGSSYGMGTTRFLVCKVKGTPASDGNLNKVYLYAWNYNQAGAKWTSVALYSDNAGAPGALIAYKWDNNGITEPTSFGWISMDFNAPLQSGVQYWVGIQFESKMSLKYDAAAANTKFSTPANWMETWAGGTNLDYEFSVYLDYTATAYAGPNYYVNSASGDDDTGDGSVSAPYKTLLMLRNKTFSANAIIEGNYGTYYDRHDVPSSGSVGQPITYQNITIDGSVTMDDPWSIVSALKRNGYSWALDTGEVYKKYCTAIPKMLFEDGVNITAVACANEAACQAISRGCYGWYNSYLYYRASDGAAPSTHELRANQQDTRWANGCFYANGKDYISLDHIYCQNAGIIYGISLISCDHWDLDHIGIEYCGEMSLNTVTYLTGINLSILNNVFDGVAIQGDGSDEISLSGIFRNNGRELYVTNATTVAYGGDGDNIGIGGSGGTIGTITIHNSIIQNSGPPDGNASGAGSGIYVGTANVMELSNLNIFNNIFLGNHYLNLRVGDQINNCDVYNNIFLTHDYADYQTVSIDRTAINCETANIWNNVFYGITGRAALYLNNTSMSGTAKIQNNIFLDNGVTGAGYLADLWIASSVAGDKAVVTVSNNSFYRNDGVWSTTDKLVKTSSVYDISHIVANGAGTFETDWAGSSQSNIITDPLFVNAGGSYLLATDFKLQSNSPCIKAGDASVNNVVTHDYAGKPRLTKNSIGAYEYWSTGGSHTLPGSN
jgi:hypothetical protein